MFDFLIGLALTVLMLRIAERMPEPKRVPLTKRERGTR